MLSAVGFLIGLSIGIIVGIMLIDAVENALDGEWKLW